MSENIVDRIEKRIREWDQWSPAERRRMDDVVKDIMDHVRNGTGNGFIRWWCERFLKDVEIPSAR